MNERRFSQEPCLFLVMFPRLPQSIKIKNRRSNHITSLIHVSMVVIFTSKDCVMNKTVLLLNVQCRGLFLIKILCHRLFSLPTRSVCIQSCTQSNATVTLVLFSSAECNGSYITLATSSNITCRNVAYKTSFFFSEIAQYP